MYYGFFSFYTLNLGVWLILPGGFLAAYQIYRIAQDGLGASALNLPWIPVFAIYLTIWCTIMVEKWKRKQAELAYRWDTSDKEMEEAFRGDFWGPERYDSISGKVVKHFSEVTLQKGFACAIVEPKQLSRVSGITDANI